MSQCSRCVCDATTSRVGLPVCWHHADHGLDGAACPGCDAAPLYCSDCGAPWAAGATSCENCDALEAATAGEMFTDSE